MHLRNLLPFFAQYYLVANANPPKSLEDEPIDLTMLACPIFDFVFKVSRTSKAKNWLTLPNVEALVIAMFGWMQMTEDDVSHFICSLTAFLTLPRRRTGEVMPTPSLPTKMMIHNRTQLVSLDSIF